MIWRIILGGLWKPVLAALAVLGLYAKGRADGSIQKSGLGSVSARP